MRQLNFDQQDYVIAWQGIKNPFRGIIYSSLDEVIADVRIIKPDAEISRKINPDSPEDRQIILPPLAPGEKIVLGVAKAIPHFK